MSIAEIDNVDFGMTQINVIAPTNPSERLANNKNSLKYILPYKKSDVKFFRDLTEGHLVFLCLRFQIGQELALWFLYRTVARLTSFTGYVIIILSKYRKRQRRFRVTPIDVIAPTNLSERLANNKKRDLGACDDTLRVSS